MKLNVPVVGTTSGPAKIRRAMECLRTAVVKGLGVKLLDRVLELMEEEDDHQRQVSGPHLYSAFIHSALQC